MKTLLLTLMLASAPVWSTADRARMDRACSTEDPKFNVYCRCMNEHLFRELGPEDTKDRKKVEELVERHDQECEKMSQALSETI